MSKKLYAFLCYIFVTIGVVAQPCLQVQCPTNKTVSCSSSWAFDLPVVSTCCSAGIPGSNGVVTNYLITSTGTVTNGACPQQTITQSWVIMDGCRDVTNCSQTVTILGCCQTNCLQVQCSSDKSVNCGTAWSFDAPVVSTCCTNPIILSTGLATNILVTSTGITTNGACPKQLVTQTWSIMDGCGNSTNCSQTVTILGCCQTNCLQVVCPTNKTVDCGIQWNFDLPIASTCCPSNVPGTPSSILITTTTTITNGTCPQVTITRFWQITDGCGNQTNCSQVVTVLGCCQTNCLQVVCPTNKTVDCGIQWNFNLPIVSTCCQSNVPGTSSNILITTTATITNGSCPQLTITRFWQITDGCGSQTNCSQVVTVLGCCQTNCLQVQCPTNKTVECGTSWSFNPPIATSCCSNLAIVSVSQVTNGVCPKIVTKTWKITDGCGATNFCSQQVTLVDTTPPTIVCPSVTISVTLNSHCQMVIPAISVTASDSCTPPCSLVYSQSPPAGTVISGTSANVLVTVTDLCGNSSSCIAHVIGVDKTPPVITCPASMTVTNCTIPCVPVTASDNCCPQNMLTITQSPACGTTIGPGTTSITVTVTDCHGNSSTKVVQVVVASTQSFLYALTNTGVGPGGVLYTDGVLDPHYALPPASVPAGMPTDYAGTAVAVSDICHTVPSPCGYNNTYTNHLCWEYVPWSLAPDAAYVPAASKWISPDYVKNGCCTNGLYTYTLTFVLPGSMNPATASISGRWAADDTGSMKINGVTVPTTSPSFGYWSPFTIPAGLGIVSGVNQLKFIVNNASIFTGLRVEFTDAHANCLACAPPYIIWASAAQLVQLGGTATFNVTAGGSTPQTFQWFHNAFPIPGATNSTLQIPNVGFGSGGSYTVYISNPCGAISQTIPLTVYQAHGWQWGDWNASSLANPLAATVGPDLIQGGSTFAAMYGITSGSTEDFGLPAPGGRIQNIMEINPESGGQIQIPPIMEPGTSNDASYTVLMDYYEPDRSYGMPSTLFQSVPCCLGSSGQDGVALTLDASNYVHVSGSFNGIPFDSASAGAMPLDTWIRLGLVVNSPTNGGNVAFKVIANGIPIIIVNPCLCCILPYNPTAVSWAVGPPIVFSAPTNAGAPNGEFFVSSIQFHDIAFSDDSLAGLGTPDDGPLPVNDTHVGPPPLLTASVVKGQIQITWNGTPYALQETTDLSSGIWNESDAPFTESDDGAGGVTTIARPKPSSADPAKFYRLMFRP